MTEHLDFVVHAPVPYRHRSAGFRALYILANELSERGHRVGIKPLPMPFLSEYSDPDPFGIASSDQRFWPGEYADSIHVVPEGFDGSPARKTARWMLSPIGETSADELTMDWLGLVGPRLVVDVIEGDLFYPKKTPGRGLLYYGGKGANLEELGINLGPDDGVITAGFPATRAELADLLRSAAGLVSFDNFSSINLEATICGTVVLMGQGEMPLDSMFGRWGVIATPHDYERGAAEVEKAAEHYEWVRSEIALDVDLFIEACREKWPE